MSDLLDEIFAPYGLLKKAFKDFEERPGQKEMARQIFDAYEKRQIALIEAGTGIGKSLAYLIPAILWAIKRKEKTVISTYTISLQEQLLHKDIPTLLKILNVDLKATLVKGMSNYVCLRKLDELEEEDQEIVNIKSWAERTHEGSRSDLAFSLSSSTWDKVNADAYSCNHVHCPHYKQCFFFKARRQAADAQLLIVNHHLLFADLAAKKRKDYKEERAIIPPYQRIALDEAHHLEGVALESLSKRFDRLFLMRLCGRIYSDLNPERSRLFLIRQAITANQSSLIPRLEIDLPAEKREIVAKCEKAFEALEQFCRRLFSSGSQELKWRLKSEVIQDPLWEKEIKVLFMELAAALKRFVQSLSSLKKEIENELSNHALEMQSIITRLEEQAEGLEEFFQASDTENKVQWVEMSASNIALIEAKLSISSYLKEEFFTSLPTLSLCSATLSTSGNFNYLKERIGIPVERAVTENIYHSPFDYSSQALLAVPTDLPDPSDPLFSQKACQVISQAVEISQGGAFVLFTSYEMLKTAHQFLLPLAEKKGLLLLRQGETSRKTLIEKFKKHPRSVLLGTDSFWEGVDVTGEALRLVIIVKLPFKVPTDPLIQALSEHVEKEGKNAFMDYHVPQAVMKFKQGFGRLIRTKTDRGCILSLDKRLVTKAYGKLFLQSLPPCRTLFAPMNDLLKNIEEMIRTRTT